MQQGSFQFELNYKLNAIILTITGFLTSEQVTDLLQQQADAEQQISGSGCPFDLLLDLSKYVPQTSSAVADFSAFVNNSPLKARRVAVVDASALASLQVRRILSRADAQRFDNLKSAKEWLASK